MTLVDLGPISPTCLQKTFTLKNPKSTKRQSSLQCCFALLGSACVKAARKMLVKFMTDEKVWLQKNGEDGNLECEMKMIKKTLVGKKMNNIEKAGSRI